MQSCSYSSVIREKGIIIHRQSHEKKTAFCGFNTMAVAWGQLGAVWDREEKFPVLGWHRVAERYENFLRTRQNQQILFLELGVGYNTPDIIKYSFWRMTHEWRNAEYICTNVRKAYAPEEIRDRSTCMQEDIGEVLKQLK